MSDGTFGFGGDDGGAAAAAAAAELVSRQEEEEMTNYRPGELAENWEFKILRSNTGAFLNPQTLRAVLDQEARAGWVLVEKFDNQRIRLKRPSGVKVTEDDLAGGYDPYRTDYHERSAPQGWGCLKGLFITVVIVGSSLLIVILLSIIGMPRHR